MRFLTLSHYLQKLENTGSRIEITNILAHLFREADVSEIDEIVYLSLGLLAAKHEGVVFNVAERLLITAISQASNTPHSDVLALYKKTGDLGSVAESLSSPKKCFLSVEEVFQILQKIAQAEGGGSVERKVTLMSDLLQRLDPISARYIVRIPLGKLRLGFSDKTVLDALSVMENGDKSGKKQLEAAYQVLPDVGLLAQKVKESGIVKATKEVTPKVGIPVLPMLAQRLKSPAEMVKKMGKVAVEPKLDGLRVQIHFKRGERVRAFTRNLNDISWMFPELSQMENAVKGNEIILDSEAMGIDEEQKKLANFQTTMTRRRKHDIDSVSLKVGIQFFVFDVLVKDGVSLLNQDYLKRREILKSTVTNGKLFVIPEMEITQDPQKITNLNTKYRKAGLEGILVKKMTSGYVPGRTGWNWVKMKEAEYSVGKIADTVDALVMGYYFGRGKRTSFGIGGFLAGVRNEEKILTVTKVGTGLTDEQFKELKVRLDKIETSEKPKEYELVHKDLNPDVWVSPEVVVELAGDDLTVSTKHGAGYAIRFPRLVKFRDDKSVEQITTVGEIKKLFKLQS